MRNEARYIEQCLTSLLNQDYPPGSYEILVVDGLSDDGSREIVFRLAKEHPIRLLTNPDRTTPAGLNIGVQAARGEIVILLGAHATAAPDFIQQSVRYLQQTDSACVGGPIRTRGETWMARAISLALSSPFGVGNAFFRYAQRELFVDTVAFGAYRREVFDHIGLFDETLTYAEDDDFNYRLRRQGGKILLTPAIRTTYYARTSLPQLWRQYVNYGVGKARAFQKHGRVASWRHLVPASFVLALVGSVLLAALVPKLVWVLVFTVGSYLLASLLFSVWIAARHGWAYLPLLPVVFLVLHLGYGIGFIWGLVKTSLGSSGWRMRKETRVR